MRRMTDKYANTETLEKFIKGKLSVDILALYLVYKNIDPCWGEERTDIMTKEILRWNNTRLLRVKNKLVELDLLKIYDNGAGVFHYKMKELLNTMNYG